MSVFWHRTTRISAASLLFLSGCAADSSSEPPQSREGRPVVEFSEATADSTQWYDSDIQAPEGVTTTLNIKEFKVTAVTRNQYSTVKILDDVIVTRKGINSWTYPDKVEWPEYPVDFYEVSPVDVKWEVFWWHKGVAIYGWENTGTTDLVVGAQYGAVSRPGPIKVNLRHALASVDVSLRTDIPDRYSMTVKRAYIMEVNSGGNYNWPTQTTDQQSPYDVGTPEVSGDWYQVWTGNHNNVYNLQGYPEEDYKGTELKPSDIYTPLDQHLVRFMVPGSLIKSNYTGSEWRGSNIMIVYRITDRNTGETIWPTASTSASLRAPKDSGWALACYGLYDVTPDHKWLAGINYRYRLTLHLPPEAGTRASDSDISVSIAPY